MKIVIIGMNGAFVDDKINIRLRGSRVFGIRTKKVFFGVLGNEGAVLLPKRGKNRSGKEKPDHRLHCFPATAS